MKARCRRLKTGPAPPEEARRAPDEEARQVPILERYKLVRKIKVSTASEHDKLDLKTCSVRTTRTATSWPDKGYVDGERDARLSKQGWRMHIQREGSKDKPVSDAQRRRNPPCMYPIR